MTNAVQYVSIYLFNKSITIYWSSQAMHFHRQKERKKIIQTTNRALCNLIIILSLSNLTYAFGAQDNESSARSHWAAGRYIYIKKYVLGWCTLLILSRWTTDRYATIVRLFDSYWYINLSLTRILTVNIFLKALKSFNTIYNNIYIHLYANRTFSHSSNFLMQIRFTSNCLKSLKTNHFKHKSICTFLSIISKIQIMS